VADAIIKALIAMPGGLMSASNGQLLMGRCVGLSSFDAPQSALI
jgi:hypothetical protein